MSDYCRLVEVDDGTGRSQQVKLNIWDAAGDGNMHNLAPLFVRDIQVGVLVYSIDSKASYENMELWLEHI